MAEPSSGALAVLGTMGAGYLGVLVGVNVEAAIGALFGALIYFSTIHELGLWKRSMYFVASFVMGYLFSPAIGEFEFWGMHPFAFPGPAAFGASLLVVTVSLAALRRKGVPPQGGTLGGADD